MRTNRIHLTTLLAASAAATASICAPALLAAPTPHGGICVMAGPKATCLTPGDVELHSTPPSISRYPRSTGHPASSRVA